MSTCPPGVATEHAALCRHLGRVQDRMTRLLLEKELALRALSREVVRLRGQLIVARTTLLWGMAMPVASVPLQARASTAVRAPTGPAQDLEAARKVICQTGCAGHAHAWLAEDGQCRWIGRDCDGGRAWDA